MGTEGGLSCFDYVSETFRSYRHDRADSLSISNGGVLDIMEDSKGRLWIGTWDGGINLLLPEHLLPEGRTVGFRHIANRVDAPYSLHHNAVWTMEEDKVGRLWFGTFGGGLDLLVPPNDSTSYYSCPIEDFKFVNFQVANEPTAIKHIYALEADENTLWIGSSEGLSILNLAVLEDSNALETLYTKSKTVAFDRYVSTKRTQGRLSDNQIVGIYRDNQGIFWLSTQKGISIHNTHQARIPLLSSTLNKEEAINITSLFRYDSETIWLGTTYTGIQQYNISKDESAWLNYVTAEGRVLEEVRAFMKDTEGIIWIGTKRGLFQLHPESERLELFHHPDFPKDILVQEIFQDTQKRTWIVTQAGLYLIEQEQFFTFKTDPYNASSLSSNSVSDILEDSKGRIWISTNGGGFCEVIKGADGRYYFEANYGQNQKSDQEINLVHAIAATTDGLWIGGQSVLYKYLFEKDSCVFFPTLNRSINSINSIEVDRHENIWISGPDGIARYDEKTDRLTQFQLQDGVVDGYHIRSNYKDTTGRIYFGGESGFHAFYGEQITLDSIVPTPKIRYALRLCGGGL